MLGNGVVRPPPHLWTVAGHPAPPRPAPPRAPGRRGSGFLASSPRTHARSQQQRRAFPHTGDVNVVRLRDPDKLQHSDNSSYYTHCREYTAYITL